MDRSLRARDPFGLGVGAVTAAAGAFLAARLTAWPPHEDEVLPLFVGREDLPGVLQTVLGERGGAPLHYLFAWAVAHLGLGLPGLRLVSALFAVASLPLVALLVRRLAGPATAVVATALAAASWLLLFHGVYARMYSLFLFTSALSYLTLLQALERGGRRAWAVWVGAALATVATHPYGALVLASQAAYVALVRTRVREAVAAFAVVAVAGIPFWITDLVLAGRFEVGVGGGGGTLGDPAGVAGYLWQAAGDASSGYRLALVPVLAFGVAGALALPRRARILTACVIGVPLVAFLLARMGGSAAPESRHLIFALPFFAAAVAAGVLRLPRRAAVAAIALLLAAEVAWAWDRTPPLFEGEPRERVEARRAAATWLAETSRPDDILLGYDPLFLGAWERDASFPDTVLPRADGRLAARTLRELEEPLGRGVFVFDASDTANFAPSLRIERRVPEPRAGFEARVFGPFLVIRTREPTGTPRGYLDLAARALLVGKALDLGDADVNLAHRNVASLELSRQERSRSSVSR